MPTPVCARPSTLDASPSSSPGPCPFPDAFPSPPSAPFCRPHAPSAAPALLGRAFAPSAGCSALTPSDEPALMLVLVLVTLALVRCARISINEAWEGRGEEAGCCGAVGTISCEQLRTATYRSVIGRQFKARVQRGRQQTCSKRRWVGAGGRGSHRRREREGEGLKENISQC